MVDRIWDTYPERKAQMTDLSQKIRPAMRFSHLLFPLAFKYRTDDGALYYIKSVDPFEVFTKNPRPGRRAQYLVKLRAITTYHTHKGSEYFRPSTAEVIAQIPEELLAKTAAFEISVRPEARSELSAQADIASEGYHRATTILYSKRNLSGPWGASHH